MGFVFRDRRVGYSDALGIRTFVEKCWIFPKIIGFFFASLTRS